VRHLLPALLLLQAACAGSLESALRDADGRGVAPTDLRVLYDDHDALLGGDRIEISGDGHMRIWRFRPGFVSATDSPEQSLGDVEIEVTPQVPPTEERVLSAEDLSALVAILLEVEPWDQAAEQDETRLDRRRAVLRAELGGARDTCWEWISEIESDDSRIRRFLRWARTRGALPDVEAPAPPEETEVPSLTSGAPPAED
jgi:hypothetical protein